MQELRSPLGSQSVGAGWGEGRSLGEHIWRCQSIILRSSDFRIICDSVCYPVCRPAGPSRGRPRTCWGPPPGSSWGEGGPRSVGPSGVAPHRSVGPCELAPRRSVGPCEGAHHRSVGPCQGAHRRSVEGGILPWGGRGPCLAYRGRGLRTEGGRCIVGH